MVQFVARKNLHGRFSYLAASYFLYSSPAILIGKMMPPGDESIFLIDNRHVAGDGRWPETVDSPGVVFVPVWVQDINRVSGFAFRVFILLIIYHC
jgi:hypothetical protein